MLKPFYKFILLMTTLFVVACYNDNSGPTRPDYERFPPIEGPSCLDTVPYSTVPESSLGCNLPSKEAFLAIVRGRNYLETANLQCNVARDSLFYIPCHVRNWTFDWRAEKKENGTKTINPMVLNFSGDTLRFGNSDIHIFYLIEPNVCTFSYQQSDGSVTLNKPLKFEMLNEAAEYKLLYCDTTYIVLQSQQRIKDKKIPSNAFSRIVLELNRFVKFKE